MGTRLSGSRLQAVLAGEARTLVTVGGVGVTSRCASDCEEHAHPLLSSCHVYPAV